MAHGGVWNDPKTWSQDLSNIGNQAKNFGESTFSNMKQGLNNSMSSLKNKACSSQPSTDKPWYKFWGGKSRKNKRTKNKKNRRKTRR